VTIGQPPTRIWPRPISLEQPKFCGLNIFCESEIGTSKEVIR